MIFIIYDLNLSWVSKQSSFLLLYGVSSRAEGKCGGGDLKPKNLIFNPISAIYWLYDQWFLTSWSFFSCM